MLKKLWNHLSKRRQKQLWLILILMVLSSFLEIVSIGAIIPFLGILTAPEHIFQHQLMQPLVLFFGLTSPNQLTLPLTIVFIMSVLFANAIRLALLFTSTRY